MKASFNIALVSTIKERCRVCYTCVRECPAKAIRIYNGQAEVIIERCVGCGNCVRVCSQQAKQVYSCVEGVERILESRHKVAACVAPSFPAEFSDVDAQKLVGMIRELGFDLVVEVALGADLVAREYKRLMDGNGGRRYIGTTCPAVVGFIERYHPDLVAELAPVVSPMVATSRAMRRIHGDGLKIVFIGPCIAKKLEAACDQLAGEVDAAITFKELRAMFEAKGITAGSAVGSDFDPPCSGLGTLFPLSRGLLQAAQISEDLKSGEVVTADGRSEFQEALKEFESGDLDVKLLEVLCCNGCVMGPGMTCQTPLFQRRSRVSQYVRSRTVDPQHEVLSMESMEQIDLTRTFAANDHRVGTASEESIREILVRMGKTAQADMLNCGACGYDTCRDHAIAIYRGLAESEMCLPYTIDLLKTTVKELAISNEQLASTQEALMHSEKLASMGQLAAGIAHEVNNPLGVVLLYSHLLLEDCAEDSPLREDLTTIARETDRCKKIVAGLLNFARQNKVILEPTNVRELVERSLRSLPFPESITCRVIHDMQDPMAELDGDQVMQVLINLLSNAVEAMPEGGVVTITTHGDSQRVGVTVADTGVGIPAENVAKIFEPFFTTKQIGKGTGLGLAVTYGIVKMHRGDISVTSNTDPSHGPRGTTFTVTLPRKGQQE